MAAARDDAILDMIFNNPGEFVFPEHKQGPEISAELLLELKQLELEAVGLAQQEKLELALELIDRGIQKCSVYGSLYNNKAQILVLQEKFESSLAAIELAIKYGDSIVISKAFTQKGLILTRLGKKEEAEQAYQQGARYGNPIAKQQVAENPYAKMCNSILVAAMKQ